MAFVSLFLLMGIRVFAMEASSSIEISKPHASPHYESCIETNHLVVATPSHSVPSESVAVQKLGDSNLGVNETANGLRHFNAGILIGLQNSRRSQITGIAGWNPEWNFSPSWLLRSHLNFSVQKNRQRLTPTTELNLQAVHRGQTFELGLGPGIQTFLGNGGYFPEITTQLSIRTQKNSQINIERIFASYIALFGSVVIHQYILGLGFAL